MGLDVTDQVKRLQRIPTDRQSHQGELCGRHLESVELRSVNGECFSLERIKLDLLYSGQDALWLKGKLTIGS